ncbi:trypsin-like cysteine/serine peptidase domain-containing protein, partial [Thamnocephalis sphaerospora]
MSRLLHTWLAALTVVAAVALSSAVTAVSTTTAPTGLRHGTTQAMLVGGTLANDGAFPFAVKLLRDGRVMCAGSVLSDTWILTAAHCLYESSGNASGGSNINVTDPGRLLVAIGWALDDSRVFSVKRAVLDPDLDVALGGGRNDIGLIQLADPLELATSPDDPLLLSPGNRMLPVRRWPPNRPIPTGPYLAVGWGRTEDQESTAGLRSVPLLPS